MGEATAMKRVEEPAKAVKQESLFNEMEKTFNAMARRAYEIFAGNGRVFGRDLDNWLQAERELLHPVALNMTETDEAFTVKAEVPGFTEKEIEVAVEQGRLVITGQKEDSKEEKKGKTVCAETRSDRVLRVVDLPGEVEADKVTATLKNGVLELVLPKVAKVQPVRIHPKAA
jgi:HSP20 family molecular chaperone IbpA